MTRKYVVLTALLLTAVACGSDSSPTAPGQPGPSGATITILANGTLSPAQVEITVGQSVTFVNQDSRNHQMSADPHPSHADCPQIQVLTTPGQTKSSNALPVAKVCGLHDHLDPSNVNLLGRVTVR